MLFLDYVSYAPEVVRVLYGVTDVIVTQIHSYHCHCLSRLASLYCTLILLIHVTV